MRLHGFRDSDVSALREHFSAFFPGAEVTMAEASVSGKNWGEARVEGNQLQFLVGGKAAFNVDCADISNVSHQGKTDVLLEFAHDDTAGAAEKDSLCEMSFHVPLVSKEHAAPPGAEDEAGVAPVPAKVLADSLLSKASVGPATGEPIALFSEVAVLIPRGRFSVELHAASLRLVGQAADFKIQYSSILRLFILPRPNASSTLSVLSLDPPIRRGATHYPHLVLSFAAEEEVEVEPSLPQELQEKYAGRLEARYTGAEADVFAKVLKALSGTKTTRQGSFASPHGGPALRCVHKADDGHLYPLEKAFFFLPKPTIFIRHDEVSEVEFERGSSANSKTFDLKVSLTNDTHYRFTGIAKAEYEHLLSFLQAKQLHVASLAAPQRAHAGLGLSDSEEEERPRGILDADMLGEESEEDVDFKAEPGAEDDDGEPSSESDEEGEEGEAAAAAPKKAPVKRKAKEEAPEEGGKKKRAKKDKNAPKGALSAFMLFSKERRPSIVLQNPGTSFGEVGKLVGAAWKAADAEERAPFEAAAKIDKARAAREMAAYKAGVTSAPAEEDDGALSDAPPEEGTDGEEE